MNTALLIIIGVLGFATMVILHELGHFISAKLSGVRVNEFAVGMGPKLFSFKKGDTLYSLRLFPIGGFCSMEGEDEESDDPKAFTRAKVWKRFIIIVMGAVMNLIFGFILMMILQGQETMFTSTTISVFKENSVSETRGLQAGDTFVKMDGYSILTATDVNMALSMVEHDNRSTLDIVVRRNGQNVILKDFEFPQKDGFIYLDFLVKPIEKNAITLVTQTFKETVSMVKLVWVSLYGMITGRFGLNDMAGPVGAVNMVSQAASEGMKKSFLNGLNNLIRMLALISVNLGVVNLLPLPALDGGRLVFVVIEGIFRRPVSRKYEAYIHAIGFVLLMLLTVVLTFNDIVRILSGGFK